MISVFCYLYEASKIEDKQLIDQFALKPLSENAGGDDMSIADQLIEEGRQEGSKTNSLMIARRIHKGGDYRPYGSGSRMVATE